MNYKHGVRKRIDIICQQCGSVYKARVDGSKKYCSRKCCHESQKRRIILICQQCKKPFDRPKSAANKGRSIFCSKKCVDNWKKGQHFGKSTEFKKGMKSPRSGIPLKPLFENKRTCVKCKKEKTLEEFTIDKTCCYGKSYTCKRCTADKQNKRYAMGLVYQKKGRIKLSPEQKKENRRRTLEKYKPKAKKIHIDYYKKNKDKIKSWKAEYQKKNYEKIKVKSDRYRKENLLKVKDSKAKQYQKNKTVPKFVINMRMSGGIRKSLNGGKGKQKWTRLVDFTVEQLKRHLEKQFLSGMNWKNVGNWHIDHVIPISAFNFNSANDLDFKRCWALNNLQPLWGKDNMSKGARIEKPFQPALMLH